MKEKEKGGSGIARLLGTGAITVFLCALALRAFGQSGPDPLLERAACLPPVGNWASECSNTVVVEGPCPTAAGVKCILRAECRDNSSQELRPVSYEYLPEAVEELTNNNGILCSTKSQLCGVPSHVSNCIRSVTISSAPPPAPPTVQSTTVPTPSLQASKATDGGDQTGRDQAELGKRAAVAAARDWTDNSVRLSNRAERYRALRAQGSRKKEEYIALGDTPFDKLVREHQDAVHASLSYTAVVQDTPSAVPLPLLANFTPSVFTVNGPAGPLPRPYRLWKRAVVPVYAHKSKKQFDLSRRLAARLGRPRYLYLFQTDAAPAPSLLEEITGDFICISFRTRNEICNYYPNSTWTQGRNYLIALGKTVITSANYLYYALLDGDIQVRRANFSVMEDTLLKFQPAVAVPIYKRTRSERTHRYSPAQTVTNFDAIVTFFHRNVVRSGLAVPYCDLDDRVSWWHSQQILMILSVYLYERAVLEVNSVVVTNSFHGQYPRDIILQEKYNETNIVVNFTALGSFPLLYTLYSNQSCLRIPGLYHRAAEAEPRHREGIAKYQVAVDKLKNLNLNGSCMRRVRDILRQPLYVDEG